MLALEIEKKRNTDRDLIFEEKRQKALQKNLGCKFTRINTSNAKNGFDLDFEVGNIHAFIDEFKNKKNKRTRNDKWETRYEKQEIINDKLKNKKKIFKKFNKTIANNNKYKLIINNKYKNKMKIYCVKCKKDTENIDPKIVRTKNNRLVMQSKCGI